MKQLRQSIESISQAFNLGSVVNIRTVDSDVKGFALALFSTDLENDLKYYYKLS